MWGTILHSIALWKIVFSKNSYNNIFFKHAVFFTVTLPFFQEGNEYMSFPIEAGWTFVAALFNSMEWKWDYVTWR